MSAENVARLTVKALYSTVVRYDEVSLKNSHSLGRSSLTLNHICKCFKCQCFNAWAAG